MKREALLFCALSLGCETLSETPGDAPAPGEDASSIATDGGAPCADDLQWFERELWAPILSVRCVGCHNADGPARATRMVLRSEDEPGWLEHNFRAARTVATTHLGGVALLLLRPTGRHPMGHTGGVLAAPASTEYASLARFVARVETPACDDPEASSDGGSPTRCTTVTPGPRLLRRLTPAEYDRTVRDLTGVDSHHGERFATDPVVDGFNNDAAQLTVSPLLAEQLRVAAEAIATETARDMTRLAPCAPTLPTDPACARRMVESFGERAFRRPLTSEEVNRYVALHTAIATSEGFAEGAEATVTAMLQSPHFLYRAELGVASGSRYTLTPWELASELSYLLTGTMPDAELFAAARANALSTPAQLEAQTRRLLATPGAREALRRFVRQWLDVERLTTVPKDGAIFAEFTPAVRASMLGEFDRFVDETLLRPGARLPELLTAGFTFVNPTLASFYNLRPDGTPDAQGFSRVSTTESQRFGVLSLGAVMATHARPNSSSPVHRGRMVRERLLCQTLPPPPPGINAQPPTPDPRRSLREQYAMHAANRPCSDCHRLTDPIGFTFEPFDGVGRVRSSENGMTIDTRGEIVGSARTNGEVRDARALIERLAASPEVHDCFARQLFRYAYAVAPGEQTACALGEVQQGFRAGELSLEALITALTHSVHFTERTGDEGATPTPDAGAPRDATADATADATTPPDVSAPDATTPGGMTTAGITTMTVRDSTWEAGFCERVLLHNPTGAPLTWTVVHRVEGRITTNWNSEREGDTGDVVFRGAMWNRVLMPNERTELGFCASR